VVKNHWLYDLTPAGVDILIQLMEFVYKDKGNALGQQAPNEGSPERAGQKISFSTFLWSYVPPFQGVCFFNYFSQGVARRCPGLICSGPSGLTIRHHIYANVYLGRNGCTDCLEGENHGARTDDSGVCDGWIGRQ
jgi:hypothetical protein